MTKLQAVNLILRNAGKGEVAALDAGDNLSDAAEAERVLDEVELEVQSSGWYYNIREEITLTRNPDQTVTIPNTVITIDTAGSSGYIDASQVGDSLVLVKDGATTFDADPVVTYTLRYAFECIPYPVRNYIAWYAAIRYLEAQSPPQLSPAQARAWERRIATTNRRMIDARSMARKEDSVANDDTIFDSNHTFRTVGYRLPTHAWV